MSRHAPAHCGLTAHETEVKVEGVKRDWRQTTLNALAFLGILGILVLLIDTWY